MKKVEIEFPNSFESDGIGCLPVGRVMLGRHVMQLVFSPRGYVIGVVDKSAVDDGSLILSPPYDETLYGFGKAPTP